MGWPTPDLPGETPEAIRKPGVRCVLLEQRAFPTLAYRDVANMLRILRVESEDWICGRYVQLTFRDVRQPLRVAPRWTEAEYPLCRKTAFTLETLVDEGTHSTSSVTLRRHPSSDTLSPTD